MRVSTVVTLGTGFIPRLFLIDLRCSEGAKLHALFRFGCRQPPKSIFLPCIVIAYMATCADGRWTDVNNVCLILMYPNASLVHADYVYKELMSRDNTVSPR